MDATAAEAQAKADVAKGVFVAIAANVAINIGLNTQKCPPSPPPPAPFFRPAHAAAALRQVRAHAAAGEDAAGCGRWG